MSLHDHLSGPKTATTMRIITRRAAIAAALTLAACGFAPVYGPGGAGTKLYSTAGTRFKKLCIQNKLNLLDASVRHLGTDVNLVVLSNLYAALKDKVDFYFDSPVTTIAREENGYRVTVGETEDTLENVHEPYLIRQGYLVKTPAGRKLAPDGWSLIGRGPGRALF